ncbi:MAG: protein-disulfide reductase DsbD N-terminal domain-containing protein [Pirellula sp.]|jgi:hypothetical protein|nr:protein-disulfide reductase DsbD N-terminal domain-containing protein [Pirellula sp.]
MDNNKLPEMPRRLLSLQFLFVAVMLYLLGCDKVAANKIKPIQSKYEDSGKSTDHSSMPDSPTGGSNDTVVAPSLSVEPATRRQPVTAAMQMQRVSVDKSIATWNVWVKISIARGHYIYAADNTEGPFRPLAIKMPQLDGETAVVDWTFPVSTEHNGNTVYYDSVLVRRQIRLPINSTPGLSATLQFQVCNEDVCYPPATLELTGSIAPLP